MLFYIKMLKEREEKCRNVSSCMPIPMYVCLCALMLENKKGEKENLFVSCAYERKRELEVDVRVYVYDG